MPNSLHHNSAIKVFTHRVSTPLGEMLSGISEQGIVMLEFHDRKALDKQLLRISKRLNARFVDAQHALLNRLQNQLDEYFNQQRQRFDLPLHYSGTDFQLQAWKALTNIPYANTRSYQQQAQLLGNPKAFRAVASANALNPLAFFVPCHRVIAKNGSLAGYAGGLHRKQFLIELEQTK